MSMLENPMSVWVSQVMGHPVSVSFPTSTADLVADRAENRFLHLNVDLPEGVELHERVAVGGDASEREVTAEIYVPKADGPHPVFVFLHGGAWYKGSAEDERKLGMQIADAGFVVVNVDYALAPEHPFPAGLEDCLAAIAWTQANIGEFNGDPSRLSLGGASAGGNLAAAVTGVLHAEAESDGPRIGALLLLYGIYDLRPVGQMPGPNPIFESYLGDAWRDRLDDARVSPVAGDLAHFPPTYVSCGDEDMALGMSLAMVGALSAAHTPVTASIVAGANHVFLNIPDVIAGAAPELQRITAWLDAQLTPAVVA
jgi:acetyl esterase